MEKIELSDYLYYLAITVQFATLIVVSIRYRKIKSSFVSFFTLFIYSTCIVEAIGLYYISMEIYSFELYNIYTFFEFNLITLMYLSIIKEKRSLRLIKILNVVFNGIYIVSFFYVPLKSYTITIESLILSIFFVSYLRELLTSDKILNYKKLLPFWITSGFLVFYLSSVPFQLIRESLDNRNMFFIQMFLIYIMHCCFIYGLLWSKKET